MQRDQRDVLQRPAHPRGGKTESGGLRQANEFVGRDKGRDLLADAEMKGIAARQNHDGTPAMTLDLGECVADGARPCQTPAPNKIARQFQMARAADHQFRRMDQLAGNGGKSFHAVLADADDGQPALRCANCGLSTSWNRPRCAFSSSEVRRRPPAWRVCLRPTPASRQRSRWPGARRSRGRSRFVRGSAASAAPTDWRHGLTQEAIAGGHRRDAPLRRSNLVQCRDRLRAACDPACHDLAPGLAA